MDSKVTSGSIWTSVDFDRFVVDKIETSDTGTWIYYHREYNEDHEYHCLIGAFLNRFTIHENS